MDFRQMKIFLYPHKELALFHDYFTFNSIDFLDLDTYDTRLDTYGRHCIPKHLLQNKNILLILHLDVFHEMLQWPTSNDAVIKFCQHNTLCIAQDPGDSYLKLFHINNGYKEKWNEIDNAISKNSIIFVPNFVPSPDNYWAKSLKNIKISPLPTLSRLMSHSQRCFGAVSKKNLSSKNFMLLMAKKPNNRPHRDYLWQAIIKRPALIENSTIRYHDLDSNPDSYVGMQIQNWTHGYPSMDIYNNNYVEIVPETLCSDAHWLTEKTMKPMITLTPFIMVSTPGYLRYLKQLGFKTFDSLIDESYDDIIDLESRINTAVDTLESIVKQGSREFYEASRDILEHNRRHLCQLTGSWYFDTDLFLHNLLQEISAVDQ